MRTEQTLEVRWFNKGQLPTNIQQWFLTDCPGKVAQMIDSPEERTDYYLYIPECQILSCKFRQENLEIKWIKEYFGVEQFLNNQNTDHSLTTWKGKVQRWLKLGYSLENVKEKFNPNNDKNPIWIKVKKKRWQRFYKDVGFEIAYLEVAQTSWWTVAAEMEESQPQTDDNNSKRHFLTAIEEFSQTYSEKNLSIETSSAYPNWLQQHNKICS